jgi:DNA-directed RNA polymerase subunit RPC12/RpoP
MEIVFNCATCDQEFSIDEASAGSEFDCPNCGARVTVPTTDMAPARAPAPAPAARAPSGPISATKLSAGAKEEHHFKVPVRDQAAPPELLIEKPKPPLEIAAKEAVKIRVKTIRHSDCVEVGHDKFDDIVTSFLNKIGDTNIVSINTVNYQYIELGSSKAITDFGIMIVYKTS